MHYLKKTQTIFLMKYLLTEIALEILSIMFNKHSTHLNVSYC